MTRTQIKLPKLLQLVYVHNPFYLISACLFVYGLKLFFGPGSTLGAAPTDDGYIDPWYLMLSLCGVTALMAATAYLIVRFGKVWEDARSIVIVLLLMFMSISVSLDEILNRASWDALLLVLFALVFSVGTSELLIRGLKIRLAWQYRIPFYLFLGLFFGFPLWASPETTEQLTDVIRARVALFPVFAGVITLTLIPAIRLGRQAASDNGTPWSWPWFPWAVFAFLVPAVCFRSWSFSISLDTGSMLTSPIEMETAWGLYLLVPFLLPVCLVLLEIGIVEQAHKLSRGIVALAPVLLLMAIPRMSPHSDEVIFRQFVNDVTSSIGSPVFLAMIGLILFYGYAVLRGVRDARVGLVLTGLLTIFIGPETTDARTAALNEWPLLVVGPMMLGYGFLKQSSWPAFVGCSLLSIAAGVYADETLIGPYRAIMTSQLLLISVLAVGALFSDRFSHRLRLIGASLIPVTCVLVFVLAKRDSDLSHGDLVPYAATLTVVAFAFYFVLREAGFLYAGLVNLSLATTWFGWYVVEYVRELRIPEGVRMLMWGALCFVLAVLISLLKGGLLHRLHSREPTDTLPSNGDG